MDKLNINPFGLSEQSFDPAEFAKIKAETINTSDGSLSGYDCPKCRNRGNFAIPRADGSVAFRDCDCLNIRRCVKKMEASGLCEVIKKYTFQAFQDKEDWQKTIKQGAMDYADRPEGWLLFCGQSGSGKTHLCVAVCRKLLLDGVEVRYMPWRQDIRELHGMTFDKRAEAMKKLQEVPVLYIDDLFKNGRTADGSNNPTAADVQTAFEIINYRYTKQLPTIISTERQPAELVEIDEATGGRIVEMAGSHAYCIGRKTGRNYRLRNAVAL